MFIKSAAMETRQGRAIQSINEKWGEGRWCGRETIGVQVCKKKYAPFSFCIETTPADDEGGGFRKIVKVQRMFGCPHHSDLRKEKIENHGVRKGWEPFGQWSLRKAQELARRETIRLNGGDVSTGSSVDEEHSNGSSSDEDFKTMCHNGNCAWKMREKYDNVYREITGECSDEEA